MNLTTLQDLFIHELKEVYDAEHQLVEALPGLAKAATDPELKSALESHFAETREQVIRLEDVFANCGEAPEREECHGMKALLKEGAKQHDASDDPTVRDAALIAAARKVEHYEIASYGSLIAWAHFTGFDTAREPLELSIEEERAADRRLADIAETEEYSVVWREDEQVAMATSAKPGRSGSRSSTSERARSGAPARGRRAKK